MCPTSLPGPGARCRQAASAGGVPHLLSYRAAGTSRVNVAMKSRAQARMHELCGRVLTEPIKVPSGAFVAVLDPQRAAVSMLAGDLDP